MPPSSSARAGRSWSMGSSTPTPSRHSVSGKGAMLFHTSPVKLSLQRFGARRAVTGGAFYHGSPRPLSELIIPQTHLSSSIGTPRTAAAVHSNSTTAQSVAAAMHPAAAAVAAADARRTSATSASRPPAPRPMPCGMPKGGPLGLGTHAAAAATAAPAAPAAAPHPFTSAPLYEAFDPGDTGFYSPTTTEIVTSSSGSVMVQVCAHFNGAPGDKVLVCGGSRALGNWEPDAAPALTWRDGNVWTATLEVPSGTHEFKSVAIKATGPPVWEPGNNRRVVVPRPSSLQSVSVDDGDDAGLLDGGDSDSDHPDAQLVETSGGTTMVKLTTTYTAAFGEYLKVVGGPPELGAWDAGAAPALTWGEGDVWTATLELPAGEHEFKYVVVRRDGLLEWEPGENRCIHVPLPGLAAAQAAAKKVAAAEVAAAAANGAAGRKLSPAEVYQRQEEHQQLEPWQENLPQYKQQQQQQQQGEQALVPSNGTGSSVSGVSVGGGSSDWREVKFSTKYAAPFGTYLKVVGGPDQLGAWDVSAAPPLQWSEGDMWSTTLLMAPGTHEFKLVVVDPAGTFEWESGPNRSFQVEAGASAADQAAGVLQAECLYGATHATGSIWASLEEEEEQDPAAAAAAAVLEMHRQQQQQQQQQQQGQIPQTQLTEWYQQKQEQLEAAAAAADALAAAEPQRVDDVVPVVPAAPLQPLDAVVKVFKDRFAPQTPQHTSPTASQDEEDQVVKQQQQQQADEAEEPGEIRQPVEQQQEPVGDRFAAIIANRKRQQQQPPAILFLDHQQQYQEQQVPESPELPPLQSDSQLEASSSEDWVDSSFAGASQQQELEQQQQQRGRAHTPPWELDPEDVVDVPAAPASSSEQQWQQAPPDRFASQIRNIRSRSPPAAPWSAATPQQDSTASPPWEQVDSSSSQQQQSEPDAGVKPYEPYQTASSSWQQQQPPPAPAERQASWRSSRVDSAGPSSSSSSSWRSSWRSPPAESQQDDGSTAPQISSSDSSSSSSSSTPSAGRFAAYFAQQDTKPSISDRSASPSWRASSPVRQAADHENAEHHRSSRSWRSSGTDQSDSSDSASTASPGSSSDRWAGYKWRTASPEQQDVDSSGSSSSRDFSSGSTTPSGRFSKYTSGASWRSASPQPQQRQREREQEQQQQQPAPPQQQQDPPQQPAPLQHPPRDDPPVSDGRFANYISRGNGTTGQRDTVSRSSSSGSRFSSSWSASEASGISGDYLYQLGQSDYNTNVDAGQNIGMIDSLFTGNVLGHKTDIADGSLRGWEARTLNNIIGDYYIAPKFMDKVAMHITKNYLYDHGALSKTAKVPLILGIWGPKGCGKTFQTELAFKQLGVEPVVMSAGELESETAGQPGRLIRDRYRKAAELSKTRGKLSCLLINDLDAGIGRFGNTQVTVNNQIVIGTLMNICDDPNHVSVGAGWREHDEIRRVPIIVTGNDFSTLYAPLIRDGRMEKFYWQPERDDIINIVHQMYKEDGLSRRDVQSLVDSFSGQALDFFGAVRAATYDGQIRDWMASVAGAPLHAADQSRVLEVNKRLLSQTGVPEFTPVPISLDMLMAEGRRLVAEQEAVNTSRLGQLYMKGVVWGEAGADAWSSSEPDE